MIKKKIRTPRNIKEHFERKIRKCEKHIVALHADHGFDTIKMTYHAGHAIGYWKGIKEGFEQALEEMEGRGLIDEYFNKKEKKKEEANRIKKVRKSK